MTSQSDRHQELEQRERILRQKEVELRLREIEQQISPKEIPVQKTVKHQSPDTPKPWMKKVILGGKLFALSVAALVAVRIASVLAGVVIIAVLGWVSYQLFFASRKKNP